MGELVIIRQPWRWFNFEAGEVGRCPVCGGGGVANAGSVDDRLAQVYKQAGDSRCPACFGIGYEGGFKPIVFFMHAFVPEETDTLRRDRTGQQYLEQPRVQFMWEPKLFSGDLVVRVREWTNPTTPGIEHERYTLGAVNEETLHTGRGMRTWNDPGRNNIVLSQEAQMFNLPPDHIFYSVPVVP